MTPGAKRRTIRMEDAVWDELSAKAASEGTNASQVLRAKAIEYIGGNPTRNGRERLSLERIAVTGVVLGVANERFDTVGRGTAVVDEVVERLFSSGLPVPSTSGDMCRQIRELLNEVLETRPPAEVTD